MKYIVIDIETTGLRFKLDQLHGLAVSWFDGRCKYFPVWDIPEQILEVLADPTVPKVGHNVRFDLKFLHEAGIVVRGPIYCSRVLAHLLDENNSCGLKELTARYLASSGSLVGKSEIDKLVSSIGGKSVADLCSWDLNVRERFIRRFNQDPGFHLPFFQVIGRYACEDVANTRLLFDTLVEKINRLDSDLKQRFSLPLSPKDYYFDESMGTEQALMQMELPGLLVDLEVLRVEKVKIEALQSKLVEELGALAAPEIQEIEEALYELALQKRKSDRGKANVLRHSEKHSTKYNWDSSAHLGTLLYDKFGVPERRTAKGSYRTDEQILLEIQAQTEDQALKDILTKFLEYRKLGKLLSTYIEGPLSLTIPESKSGNSHYGQGGRIYPSYGPFINTGRLNCSQPNMQNVPRGSPIKRAYVPDRAGDLFIYADYSQVELRIAAHLSQDPTMLDWFLLNQDPHQLTADAIGAARQVGKRVNFLAIYDGGARRLQEALIDDGAGNFSVEECKAFLAGYWQNLTVYRDYLNTQLAWMRRTHFVYAETGRIRRVPEIVYGQFLDWKKRQFTGPPRLVQELKNYPQEQINSAEIFERASKKYSHAKKQGYNFPIQSVGASITKRAIVELQKSGFRVITTVHDSIVIQVRDSEVAKSEKEVSNIMTSAYQLSVPLKVDVKVLNSLDETDIVVAKAPPAKKI